jgi:hypothetical protein
VGEICDECGNLTERLLGSESTVRWQAERIRTLEKLNDAWDAISDRAPRRSQDRLRELGLLRQRLAEVERTPQALGTKIPDYWHEAKTLWPWLPSQPAIQLDDEWRNRTRAENALWLIEQAEQRAERAETALQDERELLRRKLREVAHHETRSGAGQLVNAYAAAELPEWEIRQRLEAIDAALAPVAEQPQPAIPHMLLVLTHKQTAGGCARCGKDWPCPDAPQPAKASTEGGK